MVVSANSYNSSSAFECWLLGHDSAILRLSEIEMNVEIIVLAADLSRVFHHILNIQDSSADSRKKKLLRVVRSSAIFQLLFIKSTILCARDLNS